MSIFKYDPPFRSDFFAPLAEDDAFALVQRSMLHLCLANCNAGRRRVHPRGAQGERTPQDRQKGDARKKRCRESFALIERRRLALRLGPIDRFAVRWLILALPHLFQCGQEF